MRTCLLTYNISVIQCTRLTYCESPCARKTKLRMLREELFGVIRKKIMVTKTSNVLPVNELNEIVLKSGVGTNNVTGYIPANQASSDPADNKMVVKMPVEVPAYTIDINNNPQVLSTTSTTTAIPVQQLGARRYEALFKLGGIASGGVAFNQTTGLSTSLLCTTVKHEQEVPSSAVKLVAVNRAANAITGLKALVGTTETAATSSSALLGSPTINGTTYQVLQGSTDANGWRSVTWAGASSVNIAAANTAQTISVSDWAAKSTVPRADGGSRHLALYRAFIDGTATNIAFLQTYTAALQTPSAPMRNRILQNSAGFSDAVATPGLGMSASTTAIEIYPIYRYTVPVFSVWSVGDSISQNDGLVADKTSTWVYRACMDLSTPQKPVVFANMAGSSQTSTTYLSTARTFLAAGVPAPSALVMSPASVNDSALDANSAEVQSARIQEALKLCSDYKIPYLIMWPWLQSDSYNSTQDGFRTAMNAKIKAAAIAAGVIFIEFPALAQGVSPERWATLYRFDNLHPNELGIETVMAPALKAILTPLI